jgi:GH24 family phage-related lysozyme (muramidase)
MSSPDLIRALQKRLGVAEDGIYGPATHRANMAALGQPVAPAPVDPAIPFTGAITAKIAAELVGHEAIVEEAYKDGKGIWTWGIGVTNASGHTVFPRYKDDPQPIARCIEIFLWLCKTKYGPEVVKAFDGHPLTEAQYAAAVSFHYNTGAIARASWVDAWKRGDNSEARERFMDWKKPASIIERREKERDLFFDGKWSSDGTTTVWPVRKPSYTPDWGKGRKVNIMADLEKALAA